jgi:hypothetical protein
MIPRSIHAGPWLAVEIIDKQLVRTTPRWIHNQLATGEMNIYGVLHTFLHGRGSSLRQRSH